MARGGFGNWLADIAANMLCVILIVLVVLAFTAGTPRDRPLSQAAVSTVISGTTAVDMLHRRLFASERVTSVDLIPGKTVAVPDAGQINLFVFDHPTYHAFVTSPEIAGRDIRELSVPRALRNAEGNGWSPDFLALAAGPSDIQTFRQSLIDILVSHQGGRDAAPSARTTPAILRKMQTFGNALLLLIGLLTLRRLSQPARA